MFLHVCRPQEANPVHKQNDDANRMLYIDRVILSSLHMHTYAHLNNFIKFVCMHTYRMFIVLYLRSEMRNEQTLLEWCWNYCLFCVFCTCLRMWWHVVSVTHRLRLSIWLMKCDMDGMMAVIAKDSHFASKTTKTYIDCIHPGKEPSKNKFQCKTFVCKHRN